RTTPPDTQPLAERRRGVDDAGFDQYLAYRHVEFGDQCLDLAHHRFDVLHDDGVGTRIDCRPAAIGKNAAAAAGRRSTTLTTTTALATTTRLQQPHELSSLRVVDRNVFSHQRRQLFDFLGRFELVHHHGGDLVRGCNVHDAAFKAFVELVGFQHHVQ